MILFLLFDTLSIIDRYIMIQILVDPDTEYHCMTLTNLLRRPEACSVAWEETSVFSRKSCVWDSGPQVFQFADV